MNLIDRILKPDDLLYDFDAWEKMSFPEQAKLSCQAWYHQGFGSPVSTLGFYVIKLALWLWIFFIFASYSTDLGTFATFSEWWYQPEAFGKFIIWTTLLEVIGLAGASGPLTARFLPPFGASTYFLRPKTIKVPFFTKAPIIVWPILALMLLNGLLDRTIFLAARGDIYFPMIACYLFADQTIPALKITLFAIWFWAAFSKLTPSFVNVVTVMICNSPIFKHFESLRKALFINAPEDLRPSKFGYYVAHFGTAVEFSLPFLLLFTSYLAPDQIFYIIIGWSGMW